MCLSHIFLRLFSQPIQHSARQTQTPWRPSRREGGVRLCGSSWSPAWRPPRTSSPPAPLLPSSTRYFGAGLFTACFVRVWIVVGHPQKSSPLKSHEQVSTRNKKPKIVENVECNDSKCEVFPPPGEWVDRLPWDRRAAPPPTLLAGAAVPRPRPSPRCPTTPIPKGVVDRRMEQNRRTFYPRKRFAQPNCGPKTCSVVYVEFPQWVSPERPPPRQGGRFVGPHQPGLGPDSLSLKVPFKGVGEQLVPVGSRVGRFGRGCILF